MSYIEPHNPDWGNPFPNVNPDEWDDDEEEED